MSGKRVGNISVNCSVQEKVIGQGSSSWHELKVMMVVGASWEEREREGGGSFKKGDFSTFPCVFSLISEELGLLMNNLGWQKVAWRYLHFQMR